MAKSCSPVTKEVQAARQITRHYTYPLAKELDLRKRIMAGDRAGALRALEALVRCLGASRSSLAQLQSDALQMAVVLVRKTYQTGQYTEGSAPNFVDLARELQAARDAQAVLLILRRLVEKLVDGVIQHKSGSGHLALRRALQYVRAHFHHNLSLEEVAAVVNLSYCYLSRLFTQEVGISFQELVTRLRIKAAKELLLETSLSVEQIATQVGYEDVSHFIRVFKSRAGVTPRQYAREYEASQRELVTANSQ